MVIFDDLKQAGVLLCLHGYVNIDGPVSSVLALAEWLGKAHRMPPSLSFRLRQQI